MQAIIVAGGFGTRLRPLTYTAPKPMLQAHHEHGADVTMSVMHVEDTREFGIVATDEVGRIERFQEKPRAEDAFMRIIDRILVISPGEHPF